MDWRCKYRAKDKACPPPPSAIPTFIVSVYPALPDGLESVTGSQSGFPSLISGNPDDRSVGRAYPDPGVWRRAGSGGASWLWGRLYSRGIRCAKSQISANGEILNCRVVDFLVLY